MIDGRLTVDGDEARTLGIDYLSQSRLAAMCRTTWVVQEGWNTSRTWISGLGGPRRSIFGANGRSRRDRQGGTLVVGGYKNFIIFALSLTVFEIWAKN